MEGLASLNNPETMKRASAYPPGVTYLDLIRKNKRQSVVLMVFMVLLGCLVGAVIGAAVLPWIGSMERVAGGVGDLYTVPQGLSQGEIDRMFENHERAGETLKDAPATVVGVNTGAWSQARTLVPSALLGAGIALVLGVLGAVWSWFGGASALLMMTGAKEIEHRDDPELFNVVDEMRIAAGLPMPRVYLIPETALNAFATGRDPAHAAVAITTGLRSRLNRDELQGVMAHELAHVRHYDIRFSLLMATMAGLIVFACDAMRRMVFFGPRVRASGDGDKGKGGGVLVVILIVVAVVLSIVAPLVAQLIQMAYSRQREYLADAGAAELTRNPLGLASALAKLARDPEPTVETANRGMAHLFIVNPMRAMHDSHQALDSVLSSHPPVKERIARLMALTR